MELPFSHPSDLLAHLLHRDDGKSTKMECDLYHDGIII